MYTVAVKMDDWTIAKKKEKKKTKIRDFDSLYAYKLHSPFSAIYNI